MAISYTPAPCMLHHMRPTNVLLKYSLQQIHCSMIEMLQRFHIEWRSITMVKHYLRAT